MLIIESLKESHIEAAARLALEEYIEEQSTVNILPDGDYFSDICKMIGQMVDGGLGVVALEGGRIKGFLACYPPRDNHFGLTKGTFSPIHAHGTVKESRRNIYSRLYQAAAKKWVSEGILSHAIALYAHNKEAVDSFFWNGFGLRCTDAIREVSPINCGSMPKVKFRELPTLEVGRIVPLKNQLIRHLHATPSFIPLYFQVDEKQLLEETLEKDSRFFIAEIDGEVVAFIEIMGSGENFACDAADMMNICGAYAVTKIRGSGIFTGLFSYLMDVLAEEGYKRCGVDFESFNPTASGFWLKYFTPYTYSVTRRIDERIYRL